MGSGVKLIIRGAGEPISVDIDREVVVGRASGVDVKLPFPFVSSRHLRIFCRDTAWMVEDLGSTNGTTCEGAELQANVPIRVSGPIDLNIQSLTLELRPTASPAEFTLALTGSIARRLASDLAGPKSNAFLEVLSGPSIGLRIDLENDVSDVAFSVGDTVEVVMDGPHLVKKDGDGFVLVGPNGSTRLVSRQRFEIDGTTFVMMDPLEQHLSEPSQDPVDAPVPDNVETSSGGIPDIIWLGLAVAAAAALGIAALFLV